MHLLFVLFDFTIVFCFAWDDYVASFCNSPFCLVLVMALAEPRADDAADKAGGDAGGGSGQPAGEDADRALFFQCGADALGQKMTEAQQGDRGPAPGKFGQRGIPADGG